MKRVLCFLLALILVLPMAACGKDDSLPTASVTTAPAPEIDTEALIAKGSTALLDRRFDDAFESFTQAGEEGLPKLENAKRVLKEDLFALFAENELQDVKKLLADLVPAYITEEDYHSWVMEYAQSQIDAAAQFVQSTADQVSDDYYTHEENMENLGALFAFAGLTDDPSAASLLEQYKLNYALLKLHTAAPLSADKDFQEAYELLKTLPEGTDGYAIAQALDGFGEYRYTEGMAVLEKYITSPDIRGDIMHHFKGESNYADDMNSMLEYYGTAYSLDDESFDADTLTENLENNKLALVYGIDKISYDVKLSETRRDQLKELSGTAPTGKILILHRRQVYGSKSTELDIALSIMKYLPAQYFPDSMEEVEYIILMDSTYAKKGKFQNGTVRILETTKLTAYDVTTGKKLTTATKKGKLDTTMYYMGEAPKYYSCGSPQMQAALIKAMEAIQADMEA